MTDQSLLENLLDAVPHMAPSNLSLDAWRNAQANAAAFAGLTARPPVADSQDFRRVVALPRRKQVDLGINPTTNTLSLESQALVEIMNERLRRPDWKRTDCKCASMGRRCITSLQAPQAWALYEAPLVGGLIGHLAVGSGKTALNFLMPMVMPECKQVVLLIPSNLLKQLVNEYRLWKEHWNVPRMMWGLHQGEMLPEIKDKLPVIHVVPYSKLSVATSTKLLKDLNPDLLIADECFKFEASVMTDRGRMPIGLVEVGMRVLSFNPSTACFEWKRVTNTFRRPGGRRMVRVHHEFGLFICTYNHKIWTEQEGYVWAERLSSRQHLRVVRNALANNSQPTKQVLSEVSEERETQTHHEGGILLKDVCVQKSGRDHVEEDERCAATRCGRTHAFQQPICESRRAKEDFGVLEGTNLSGARWERSAYCVTTSTVETPETSDGVGYSNGRSVRTTSLSTSCVQSGSSGSECEVGDRDRWQHAQTKKWRFLDHRKTSILSHLGWTVLRFWNEEVLNSEDRVAETIFSTISKLKTTTTSSSKA